MLKSFIINTVNQHNLFAYDCANKIKNDAKNDCQNYDFWTICIFGNKIGDFNCGQQIFHVHRFFRNKICLHIFITNQRCGVAVDSNPIITHFIIFDICFLIYSPLFDILCVLRRWKYVERFSLAFFCKKR